MVRVRYAPSPTGNFHVGGARTALFNYLFARQNGGQFLLRIEDTDQDRYNPNAVGWLLDGLRYLGLDWDEGPDIGGPYGPYIQTHRLDLYRKFAYQLWDEGLAYACFDENLYRWRMSPKLMAKQLIAAKEPHHIRLKLPRDGNVDVTDFLRGQISFKATSLKDPVILKTDGIPTYHLASVIDDYHMKISHVIRGEEWISSYPLHHLLYDFLGWSASRPTFVHLPLILNPTGKGKMSKRETRAPDGRMVPVFVTQYKQLGFLPEALTNFMALVGWNPGDETEFMSKQDLVSRFDLTRLNKTGAIWDYRRLEHFNQHYLSSMSVEDFAARALPYLNWIDLNHIDPAEVTQTLGKFKPLVDTRITNFAQLGDWIDFAFRDINYDPQLLLTKDLDLDLIYKTLKKALNIGGSWTAPSIEGEMRAFAASNDIKAASAFWPVRVAVTGKKVAPPLFQTMEIIGQNLCHTRLEKAINLLG